MEYYPQHFCFLKEKERVIHMTEQELFLRWKERATEDADLVAELKAVEGDTEGLHERFYTSLKFGTAGLRGVLGAGINRMNIYTVRQATQGIADHLNATCKAPTAAVAYDSRIKSELFAHETAAVFAANGIKTYIYKELMPTPALSYAVRELHCNAGVNITASHNPARYNGYKAYDETGCQLGPEAADAVYAFIQQTDIFDQVKHIPFEEGVASGMIEYIGDDFVDRYISRVLEEQVNPGICKGAGFKLVYTPLNGAGRRCVTEMLRRIGIEDVTVVPQQEWPDGNFPTCPYPNPEILEAMQLGLELYEKLDADLLLATDPDCDRVGAAVRQNGKPRLISGNEMGVLMVDYIAHSRKEAGTMPPDPIVVRSIVTTNMTDAVAQSYGVRVVPVLTGFKFIGEQIRRLEEKGCPENYLLGFEESYGYLTGGYVRDKDAVDGSLIICEMAAWYKRQGKTLADALDDLYARHGYYRNFVQSVAFEGADGMTKMAALMDALRNDPPKVIGGHAVEYLSDYGRSLTIHGGKTTPIDLPKSNVLEFGLEGVGTVTVRPSGTEPKIKVYYSIKAADPKAAEALNQTLMEDMNGKMGL